MQKVLGTPPSGAVGLPRVEVLMKDVYEILRQKEIAIERIRKEITALRFVVPLLADEGDSRRTGESPSSWLTSVEQNNA